MIRILTASLLLSMALVSGDTPVVIPGIPSSNGAVRFSEETNRAFRLEAESDISAWYSTDGKLDIGIGRTDKEQNLHHPIKFTLEELEGFFDGQKHKELIVVTVHKHVWTKQELAEHVTRLRDYFIARGYKRIVIEQAYASGRGIHLEYPEQKHAEQAGTGQPATRPESKSESSDKPQPEAEGRSR